MDDFIIGQARELSDLFQDLNILSSGKGFVKLDPSTATFPP